MLPALPLLSLQGYGMDTAIIGRANDEWEKDLTIGNGVISQTRQLMLFKKYRSLKK